MSDELSMEIIENLSEELGEKELRIMALEKALQEEKNNHNHTKEKMCFYRDSMEDRITYHGESAWFEWDEGAFSSLCFFNRTVELRIELFLECCPGRETTVKEFIEELDDSNDEAIKTGRLEPMNLNDIQEMIINGEIIDTSETNFNPYGYPPPLHSDTILIVDID
tara:strand:+ start:756 stop:1253 length:498 start_codon:yes stop_codon:yes gene_type:complete